MYGLILVDTDDIFLDYYGQFETVKEAKNRILTVVDIFYTDFELLEISNDGAIFQKIVKGWVYNTIVEIKFKIADELNDQKESEKTLQILKKQNTQKKLLLNKQLLENKILKNELKTKLRLRRTVIVEDE